MPETTQYTYGVTGSVINSNDLLASVTYPANGQNNVESYSYNALGETTGYTDRNGNAHTYNYDVLGRETSDTVMTLGLGVDGTVRRLDTAYDTGGRPYLFTSYADTGGTTVVNQVQDAYNGLGQLITEYQSHSGAVNTSSTPKVQYGYSFNPNSGGPNHSRLVSMTYPNGRVLNYNYNSGVDDRISRLSSLSESAGTLESYSYLGLDTVVNRAQMYQGATVATQSDIISGGNPDGGDKYTGLDRFGRVVEQRWVNGSSTVTDDFLYSYDQDSNVLTRSNALNSNFTEQYGYDHLNRLTSFTRGSTSESWGLDPLGNWTSLTTNGSTQTRSFNNQNQITAISGTPSTPGYDRNGNTTQDQLNQTYTFDAWNRMVKLVSGANTEVYSYDALGRRITTKLNSNAATDLYFSSAWQVLEEDVGDSMQNQYVWSPMYVDALVEGDLNGTRYYVQQDANWNVTSIVSTGGSVQERFVYDPYGQPSYYTAAWGSTSNNGWGYQFQGGRYDGTSQLYNFRNRDLSPTLGRWMEQDPIGYVDGDSNLYAFVEEAPPDATDPSGLQGANKYNYASNFLATLDADVRGAIREGGWQIHHSAQQGSVTSQTLARRLLAEGFNVHDPANLYAVPRFVHSEITQAQQSWWAEQMSLNGWINPQQAFEEIDLEKYRAFEKGLRKQYAPYMLGQKSTLCDLNAVRNNLGLPAYVPGKRNPGVISQKLVNAWRRGAGQRILGWKSLGITFGVVAVLGKLAQVANGAQIMLNIANPDEATAQAFAEFQGHYSTVLQQKIQGTVDQPAWDAMVFALDNYLGQVGAPDTFRGTQIRLYFGGLLDPTR